MGKRPATTTNNVQTVLDHYTYHHTAVIIKLNRLHDAIKIQWERIVRTLADGVQGSPRASIRDGQYATKDNSMHW